MKLEIFSTSPQSRDVPREAYTEKLIEVARWSEEFGCRGILVYTDNSLVDPWLVSQIILQNTARLCPLVAIQPLYMNPYAAAKMVASFAHLHGRQIFLNMLAGGFKTDLAALGDDTPHDDRYVRTTEYTLIMRKLLEASAPVSFEGKYYRVRNLRLTPSVPTELFPGILISGSSEAGLAAARAIGATAVKYPKPADEEPALPKGDEIGLGVRVGIVARADPTEAWRVALERFPEDRKGQLTHQLAMKTSDSVWHRQLSERQGAENGMERETYWLGPFQNYKTFCPYLVGSYGQVADIVASYIAKGHRTFVLDIPPNREELEHTSVVFKKATEQADA